MKMKDEEKAEGTYFLCYVLMFHKPSQGNCMKHFDKGTLQGDYQQDRSTFIFFVLFGFARRLVAMLSLVE